MSYPTHGPEYHERDSWKRPCLAATTANITISTALNNGDVLDGVTLATGDRVLVKDQTTGSQNGIYIVGVTPARATDYNSSAEIVGSVVVVTEGTANADKAWMCTTNATITVGTTALVFAAFGAGGGGGGGSMTVELLDASGAVSPASTLRVASFTNNGGGDISLYPQITAQSGATGQLTFFGPDEVRLGNATFTIGVDVRGAPDTIYVFAEHTPGDLPFEGTVLLAGTDYVGLNISEKDAGTVQVYPSDSGGYDVELVDQGTGKHWKTVGVLGTFNLNDLGAKSRGASIVAPAAIANTETVVASIAMPANSMQAGTTFRVKAYGRLTSGATPGSSIFRFRIGTTTLTGNIAATLTVGNAALVTNGSFVLDALVTVRTAGAGGTAIGNVSASGGTVSAFVGDISAISATVAVDTTATKLAELTFISGNAGSTATFENVVIEMAHA